MPWRTRNAVPCMRSSLMVSLIEDNHWHAKGTSRPKPYFRKKYMLQKKQTHRNRCAENPQKQKSAAEALCPRLCRGIDAAADRFTAKERRPATLRRNFCKKIAASLQGLPRRGCGGGTWTSRPSGYEPDELPTAPPRDMGNNFLLRIHYRPSKEDCQVLSL